MARAMNSVFPPHQLAGVAARSLPKPTSDMDVAGAREWACNGGSREFRLRDMPAVGPTSRGSASRNRSVERHQQVTERARVRQADLPRDPLHVGP